MKLLFSSVRFARIFFIVCSLFLVWEVARAMGYDGVVTSGLNADLGVRPRGKAIVHTLHLWNLTLSPVTVLQKPTCGCESPDDKAVTLKPFHFGVLHIPYYISPREKGRRARTILLYIKSGDDAYRRDGKVSFILQ